MHELKYADARRVAKEIKSMFPGIAIVQPVTDKQHNAIMVLTDQETMKEVEKVIKDLDIPVDYGKVE